jgi:hypothetical protein
MVPLRKSGSSAGVAMYNGVADFVDEYSDEGDGEMAQRGEAMVKACSADEGPASRQA